MSVCMCVSVCVCGGNRVLGVTGRVCACVCVCGGSSRDQRPCYIHMSSNGHRQSELIPYRVKSLVATETRTGSRPNRLNLQKQSESDLDRTTGSAMGLDKSTLS